MTVPERNPSRLPVPGGHAALLERDAELLALETSLLRAREGHGSVLLIDAPTGAGRSALLDAAASRARGASMTVLRAQGDALLRDFRFGLVLQLLRPLQIDASDDARRRLLAGPAAPAASLLKQIPDREAVIDDSQHAMIHALSWVVRNYVVAAGHAVALAVDDAHWSDAASLRFLAHLAAQTPSLPVAIILATWLPAPLADPVAVTALRRRAAGRPLSLRGLSEPAIAEMTAKRLATAEPEFVAKLAVLTRGNPLEVTAMLDEVAARGLTGARAEIAALSELVPERLTLSVRERLAALPEAAHRVAVATAVLGRSSSVPRVASLAKLDARAVLEAADDLMRTELLAPGGRLAFAQPLLGTIVLDALSPFALARAHLDAARILREQHADADEIADHLLRAPADADAAAIGPLRSAARSALGAGRAEHAVALLHRGTPGATPA